jgi:hypothetical protein
MNSRTIVVFSLLMLCVGALPHAEADVIDIPNGNLSICCWGPAQVAAYGQTFTVPAGDSVLVEYSFSLQSLNGQFPFVSQVYAWTGSNVTGPSLFTSAVLLSPVPSDFMTYVFHPSIPVTAGQQYIAFVTNQPDGIPFGGPPDTGGGMFANQDNLYAGGQFVWTLGSNPAIGPWSLSLSTDDAVFHATFADFEPGVGKNSCVGDGACSESTANIKNNSCDGFNACFHSSGAVLNNSCNGAEACSFITDVAIGNNSCNNSSSQTAGACSDIVGGAIGNNSCDGEAACQGAGGGSAVAIGNNSCNGTAACFVNIGVVANYSCNGDFACDSNGGAVENNACIGVAACRNNSGNIGSGQCIGDHACENNTQNKP